MKLSEAIRLGAMLGPQCRYESESKRGDVVARCALGGALFAATGRSTYASGRDRIATARRLWPVAAVRPAACSECSYEANDVLHGIVHLNDMHVWTREQIADFVETIEAHVTEPVAEVAHAY